MRDGEKRREERRRVEERRVKRKSGSTSKVLRCGAHKHRCVHIYMHHQYALTVKYIAYTIDVDTHLTVLFAEAKLDREPIAPRQLRDLRVARADGSETNLLCACMCTYACAYMCVHVCEHVNVRTERKRMRTSGPVQETNFKTKEHTLHKLENATRRSRAK